MRYRLLGNTGLRVAELFLGAMRFHEDGAARRVLDRYDDAGGNVVDTASMYGESENVVGRLLEGRRDRFVLATKYTGTRDARDPNAGGNHRKNLVLSLEESLRKLRTDYVDLLWVHVWDHHTPVEETMRALDDVVRAGKVLYVGISDAPAWVVAHANTLAAWRGWTPFAGLQVPYSLLERDVERELLPMAEAFGMTVAAWGPLAHGVLAGKPTDDPRALAVARVVGEVAKELNATPAQVALAWTMARSRAVHPLAGASSVEQLDANLVALDLALPPEAVARLEDATGFTLGFPGDFIAGAARVFGEAAAEGRVSGRPTPFRTAR
ncbi:aldo/keto reductase [Actinomadura macrotermitis]|uniref:L-glyceraldehyde 3-phosphate reductase n=1 Tax=Actinomadura macrotermitis TaxID=2585200 RepID=A0A7K0BZW9_9ACTN|nr:L-glyceraldehyde 3-phosphate reductase [Actinomadura macrotermitis]